MSERRRFLSALAAAPLLPAALTQTPPAPPSPAPAPSMAPPADAEAAARESVADALTGAARRIFGDRFPEASEQDVRNAIRDNLRAAERLKASGFGNADEPVTVFAAAAGAPRTRDAAGRGK